MTDVGGVNDKSFNQSAWAGVQKAMKDLGVEAKFIESKQPTDYEKNIDQFATEGYDVIVTVGFLMGDATAAKAKQYPKIKFAIIDYAYFPAKAGDPGPVRDRPEERDQPDVPGGPGGLPGRGGGGGDQQERARCARCRGWRFRRWCGTWWVTRTARSG